MREALFMALEPLREARVVDLYAGSGALGIEALSRGAAQTDFVESDRAARAALAHNLAELGLEERVRIWPLTLPRGLARLRPILARADLVLADPPYGGGATGGERATLRGLGEPGCLRPGARVVWEHHARDVLPERCGCLARRRQRRYGQTMVTTFEAMVGEDSPGSEEERS